MADGRIVATGGPELALEVETNGYAGILSRWHEEARMRTVVLLVGRLPGVVGSIAERLQDMPVEWLGAHNRDEVIRQLDAEPGIACVVMGAGLDDAIRGELIGVIASRRPDVPIHLKERSSGPDGMAPFVRRVVEGTVLARAGA